MTGQVISREAWEDAALVPVAEVRVGARHRKDLGDIAALAESIAAGDPDEL